MNGFLKMSATVLMLSTICLGVFYMSLNLNGRTEAPPLKQETQEIPLKEISENPEESKILEAAEHEDKKLILMAAGDNLIHDSIYLDAKKKGGDKYDFAPVYENIKPLIQKADAAFINQETTIAKEFPPSSYPLFNSPVEVGEEIVKTGFNIIGFANNHMLDMGEEGLRSHMEFWESKPNILSMGAWKTEDDMARPILFEKNGITLSFLPITQYTNGLSLKKDSQMRYIGCDEFEEIYKQLENMEANSDFQIVSVHWGIENTIDESQNQREYAQMLCSRGVDLIIGHHPHTLQPTAWIESPHGNKTLVTYSLGNFVSGMEAPQNTLGGVLEAEIFKDGKTGKTEIKSAKIHPIVTQYEGAGKKNTKIYPFSEYTDELCQRHGVHMQYPQFSKKYLSGIIAKNIPMEFLPEDVEKMLNI